MRPTAAKAGAASPSARLNLHDRSTFFFAETLQCKVLCSSKRLSRRHHHGRQRPLGDAARPSAHRRASRGRRAVRRVTRRRPSSASRAHIVRLLLGQLAAPAGRSEHADGLLRHYLRAEIARLVESGARLRVIGRRDRLPAGLARRSLDGAGPARARALDLRIAIDYSARDSIARRRLAAGAASNPRAKTSHRLLAARRSAGAAMSIS